MNESGRILLVGEDALALHVAFATCIAAADIAVVRDAAAGLEHLRKNPGTPPRLIVLDADGAAVVEAVGIFKADTQAQIVPLMVLCKGAEKGLIEACYAAGANACAVKPVAIAELRDLLATVTAYWLGANEVPPRA